MPSRNKKNKNRAQQPTSASKNEGDDVKISEDVEKAKDPESDSNLKFTITEAKEKLDQLRQTVDSIKASISQPNVEKTDEKLDDQQPAVVDLGTKSESEQQFETQTMKKKRNRNRNRNRNKKNQNASTDESGVSSTTGTNENSTHENSPTPTISNTTVLSSTDVITTEIKEEPPKVEISEPAKEIKADVTELESGSKPNEDKSDNITPIEVKSDIIVVELPKSGTDQKNASEESSSKSIEIEKSTTETEILLKDNGKHPIKNEKHHKDNEKQKNNRQGKNNNKNQKEKEKVADNEPKEDTIQSIENKNDNPIIVEQIEIKAESTEVKKDEVEAKNKNTKPSKDNKKSPKPNKNIQPDAIKKDEIIEKQTELADTDKKVVIDEKVLIRKDNELKDAIKQTEQLPKTEILESVKIEEPIKTELIEEKISIPFPDEKPIKDDVQNKPEEKEQKASKKNIEIKTEDIQDNKKEIKSENKHPVEQKPIELPDEVVKDNKKSKGNKKSPPQTKKHIETKPNKNEVKQIEETPKTNVQPEKTSDNVVAAPENKEEIQNIVLPVLEKDLIELSAQPPVEIEPPKELKIVETPKLEKKAEKEIKSEINDPIIIDESDKVIQKEESTSTSEVTPKIEENKKSELSIASPNEEGTQTPTTTPVLMTPAPEPTKKSIQTEDETAKIWKILEEASKSLEPVEIQMDVEPAPPLIDPLATPSETIASILCTEKNEKQVKEDTLELVTLLETKEPIKDKQGAQSKSPKMKETNQQPKQSSPSKSIDHQQKKAPEQKKKDVKPAQKNTKSNKASEQPTTSFSDKNIKKTPDKPKEKTPDKSLGIAISKTPEKTPERISPVEKVVDAQVEDITEVPLDVSIMPDEIEVAELNADSKNVQGSDFVPSVEQSTVETKSLVLKNIKVDPIQARNKSKSPIIVEKEKSPSVNELSGSQAIQSEQSQEQKTPIATKEKNNKEESDKKAVETTPQELKDQKHPQAKCSKSSEKSQSPEKGKPVAQNSKQKEASPKQTQGKANQNSKKSNGKPVVPPKPDHLVSSNKKPISDAVKSKTEKILVLTGNMEDDDSEDDYIEYKFMPRQVFIATICQSCKKPSVAAERILCPLCSMVSYCCPEHVKNDESIHKDLCAALQEIAKKRGGHIYNNARILNDNDYRSLRVHTLNLCENFLKRPLQTFEREILLFPRLCSTPSCREWRQNLLTDCPNCGQVFFCSNQPDHLIETHQRWCKSVALYQKLVVTQSISGRIEPSLPSRIQTKPYTLPNAVGDVFKDLYKNISVIKDDCVFATLTQLATAPLTAFYATQKSEQIIGEKFTIHLIGAELQFEADVLDIWETFFMHLAPNLMELTVVFCGPELNAENIPLDIISRIRMCRTCRQNCRIVKFDFQCAKFYHDYAKSSAYSKPDLICFFNPGFHHINSLNGMDTWSETIKIASSSGCPLIVTSYTEYESPRDLDRFQMESMNGGKQMTLIHGPEFNVYSSQRPERNFISDELVPLIFKNYYCFIMK